jgi:hypothetical protein
MSVFFQIVLLAVCFVVTTVLSATLSIMGGMSDEWA